MKSDDKPPRKRILRGLFKSSKPAPPAKAAAADKSAAEPAPATKKKAAVKRAAPPPIPAILLEGDRPSAPPPTGPGKRYSLGPTPPPEHLGPSEISAPLPEAYGTGQLFLAARDPHWLYAHWDLTREQQQRYNSLSADRHLVIRVFVNETGSQPFAQVHVHPESTHWFIHVANAGTKYVGQLGYYRPDGTWTVVATSGATLTPPDAMSDDSSAEFATIPIDIPFAQLIELARTAVKENIPLTEVLLQLRASGYHFPGAGAGEKWTPEKEQALASIISMDRVRRVWMGSIEITELIRRQLRQEMSSMGISSFSLGEVPGSMFSGISSFSSVSSPFGKSERRKGFWFKVNAELIIYGATEPDAEVTIGGKQIKLRPDGSFSFRFALPDGEYELPAIAVSSDKTDSRHAELSFSRDTQYRGEVGKHPQDPALKPPLVAHVA